uniref:Uncharacterized protein n=1 Tax=Panagrolaimus sp. ES5 TaxID=591445 RepID=A0AC34FV65_9BILA
MNEHSKTCEFKTDSNDKAFQSVTVSFNQLFVPIENVLCIIDVNLKNNLLVIFPLKDQCEQLMKFVDYRKTGIRICTPLDSAIADYLFKTSFYIPLLPELVKFAYLKTSVFDFVNTFVGEKKKVYLDLWNKQNCARMNTRPVKRTYLDSDVVLIEEEDNANKMNHLADRIQKIVFNNGSTLIINDHEMNHQRPVKIKRTVIDDDILLFEEDKESDPPGDVRNAMVVNDDQEEEIYIF